MMVRLQHSNYFYKLANVDFDQNQMILSFVDIDSSPTQHTICHHEHSIVPIEEVQCTIFCIKFLLSKISYLNTFVRLPSGAEMNVDP